MRNKLFASIVVVCLTAVPAAIAATGPEPVSP